MARLKELYEAEIKKNLKEKLGFKNDMAIPKIEKISINMGVGEASQDKGKIDGAVNDLKLISGQQPIITTARKSVAGFKLREGVNVGVKVTLRKQKMRFARNNWALTCWLVCLFHACFLIFKSQ